MTGLHGRLASASTGSRTSADIGHSDCSVQRTGGRKGRWGGGRGGPSTRPFARLPPQPTDRPQDDD